MTAQIIDGKTIAKKILDQVKIKIKKHTDQNHQAPTLAVILLGNDPASEIYVQHKRQACESIGIISHSFNLPDTATQEELLVLIEKLNQDISIDGILVQLPLPSHIHTPDILEKIHPQKDVDGFHPYNLGRLAQGNPLLHSCTPFGIMKLLEHIPFPLQGLHAVVIGASNIVGKPMAFELLQAGCTVTICHSKTKDLAFHVKQADILVAAIGNPNIIKSEWIKQGAVVIDVGMNRLPNGHIKGDIDFESAKKIASYITPVPGGVGPMTVAMLLENTVEAWENKIASRC
jgi:methylenetetrahydrofolate dehydrogenase (NADP+)/methenyltetrahydrofolate cyclohydrolase